MLNYKNILLGITFSLFAQPVFSSDWLGVYCTYKPAFENPLERGKDGYAAGYAMSEFKYTFYINKTNKVIKDINKNDLISSFKKRRILIDVLETKFGVFKVILLPRRDVYYSTLYFEAEDEHYSAHCSVRNLDTADLYPNMAYPSSNRGF